MLDKEKLTGLFKSNLTSAVDFWLKNSQDRVNGGISHCLDREGKSFSTDKGVWMQGRAGWCFSYLYNHFEKRQEFLDFAKSCIDFAKEKCTDTNGRMYSVVTACGEPVEKTGEWFSEAFFTMANAEYYIATADARYLDTARECYNLILSIFRDPATDPYKTWDNGSPTVRPTRPLNRPMILFNLTALMAEADPERIEEYNRNSEWLYECISDFYHPEYHATLENIAPDGSVLTESARTRLCTPGHDMECAWFLLEEGIRLGNEGMKKLAREMFDDAYKMGYDSEHGGILYHCDLLGSPIEVYDCETKVWWVHNEAIIAALALYLHTGEGVYAERFNEMVEYCFSRFVDTDGEWYYALYRNGEPISSRMKGFIYKGPFHTIRMYVKVLEMLKG